MKPSTQKKGSGSSRTTVRHALAQEAIVASGGKSIGKALLSVGYSHSIAKNPKRVLDSKGFRDLLHNQGLTEELVATSLVDDIKAKPKHRVQELSLAADILRMRGASNQGDTFVPVQINIKQLNVQNVHKKE